MCRKHEVFLQMWDMLKEAHFMVERYMVKENQMLMNLAHVSDMRHNRQLELLCHKTDGQKLADTREPRAIGLDKMHTPEEKIVLELNPVGNVFTGSNTHWSDGPSKFYVCVDIIGVRGLFNPERPEGG